MALRFPRQKWRGATGKSFNGDKTNAGTIGMGKASRGASHLHPARTAHRSSRSRLPAVLSSTTVRQIHVSVGLLASQLCLLRPCWHGDPPQGAART